MGREQLIGAFWYFISLLILTAIFLFVSFVNMKFFNSREDIRALLVVFISLTGCLMREYIIVPRFTPATLGLILYYFGVLFTRHKKIIKYTVPLLLISILTLCVCKMLGNIAIGNSTITDPPFYVVGGLSGIYSVMFISNAITERWGV